MTPDLFTQVSQASPAEYGKALRRWLSEARSAGRLQRDSSFEVYEDMWMALTAWAVGNGIRLTELTTPDLDSYLDSRGGTDDLSERYTLRLLRLIDAILESHARFLGVTPNRAAVALLEVRPDIRYSNAPGKEPPPEFLVASEAKRLVTFLSSVRPGKAAPGQPWQEIRNRTSVSLMLGAGVTPGEVRALELGGVVIDGGNSKGVPWKLRVPGNGNSPPRDTPLAPWAGQLLRHWLDIRAEQGIPGKMLFPSTRSTGKPWGKRAQYGAATEVLRAAGIEEIDGGSFRLRHTFALRQLRRGSPPSEVARWLGVSNPAVMERYARVLISPVAVI